MNVSNQKKIGGIKNSFSIWSLRLFLLIAVFFLNIKPINKGVGSILSFIEYPFLVINEKLYVNATSISSFFVNNHKLYKNYVDIDQQLVECKSDLSRVSTLKEENSALKQQLEVKGSSSKTLVMAKQVIGNKAESGIMFLKVDNNAVQPGDFVVKGNIYIGKILSINNGIARVILPMHKKSILKVFISNSKDSTDFVGKGVVIGDGVSVQVTNIVGDNVKNNDWVFVGDDDNYLVLGSITNLTQDPAAPYKTALVQPLLDLIHDKTFFILARDSNE
jgi:cell shape-determining protein MreC